jgi:hypothetical protein
MLKKSTLISRSDPADRIKALADQQLLYTKMIKISQ